MAISRNKEWQDISEKYSLDQIKGMAQAYLRENALLKKPECKQCHSNDIVFKGNELVWNSDRGEFKANNHNQCTDNPYCIDCGSDSAGIEWVFISPTDIE